MSTNLQSLEELENFYAKPDPWDYRSNPDDQRRRSELLALLPRRSFGRTLDIGCGEGFVTFELPGDEVVGVDISPSALERAGQVRERRDDAQRFTFRQASILELEAAVLGTFDLVVVTGVLYPQYIGKAASVVRARIDGLLRTGSVLASCHIAEWAPPRFPYTNLDTVLYPYRGHTHRLEVYVR